jgi:hypothetical protein
MLLDPVENPHEPLLGNDQSVAVHEENLVLTLHVLGSEKNVAQNNLVILDGEALILVSAAKSALVVRASQGHLEQNAVRLAGRPDTHSFVMHAFAFHFTFHEPFIS